MSKNQAANIKVGDRVKFDEKESIHQVLIVHEQGANAPYFTLVGIVESRITYKRCSVVEREDHAENISAI